MRQYSTLFWLLLIVWLNWRTSVDDNASNFPAPSSLSFSTAFSEANISKSSISSSIYPRNIHDWFKGKWHIDKQQSPGISSWNLKDSGKFSLFINPSKESLPDTSLVKGDFDIRDGIYSTNKKHRFDFQGIYIWETGALFLVANPNDHIVTTDHTISLSNTSEMTISNIWDSHMKNKPFPRNPFINAQIQSEISSHDTPILDNQEKIREKDLNNTLNSNSTASFSKSSAIPFDKCFFQVFMQLKPLTSVRQPERPRVFKYGKKLPFDSLNYYDDGFMVEEERMMYEMEGVAFSPNCQILLKLTNETRSMDLDEYVSKADKYVMGMILVTFILIYLIIGQMEQRSSAADIMKISLLTLCAHAVSDMFFALFHVIAAITFHPLYNSFIFTAFLLFVHFSVFQMRYILNVWKSRRPNTTASNPLLDITYLYLGVYGFLILSFIVILVLDSFIYIHITIVYSAWIPQIICNITRNTSRPFNKRYMIGTAFLRLYIPVYLYACPNNFINAEPSLYMAIWLVLYTSFQVMILLLQDKFGPRFFVPAWLVDPPYNYRRPIPRELIQHDPSATIENDGFNGHVNCVICMTDIDIALSRYMIAPCNHIFHQNCLSRWMEQKMECPTCRGSLPPPPELLENSEQIHEDQDLV